MCEGFMLYPVSGEQLSLVSATIKERKAAHHDLCHVVRFVHYELMPLGHQLDARGRLLRTRWRGLLTDLPTCWSAASRALTYEPRRNGAGKGSGAYGETATAMRYRGCPFCC
jgi:hypothetical protein